MQYRVSISLRSGALVLGACAATFFATVTAFGQSLVPLPVPSDLDSPELARFLEIRNTADKRRYALEILGREAHRLRRVDTHEAYRARGLAIAAAQSSVLTPEDEALVLRVLDRELSAEQPNWEYIEWALIATRYGTVRDDRFVGHVQAIMRLPRTANLSDSHRASVREATELLRQMNTPAAADLWEEVRALGYWQQHDHDRPVSRLARLDMGARSSAVPVIVVPSRHSNGHGAEWERLTNYREACEARVDAATAKLLARFLNDDTRSASIVFTVEHELETARVRAAEEHALAFASAILIRESAAEEPDWALVDESLRICFHSDTLPAELLPAVATILEYPRNVPELADHTEALTVALAVAGRIGSAEAVSLLIEATTREYWEDNSPVSVTERRQTGYEVDGIELLRTEALESIGFAPTHHAEPILSLVIEHHRPQGVFHGIPPEYRYEAYRIACNARHLAHSREGNAVRPCFPP